MVTFTAQDHNVFLDSGFDTEDIGQTGSTHFASGAWGRGGQCSLDQCLGSLPLFFLAEPLPLPSLQEETAAQFSFASD